MDVFFSGFSDFYGHISGDSQQAARDTGWW